jgi:hypothetical protein
MKFVPYDQSAQERLDSFLIKFDPAVEALARAVRATLRHLMPAALELVYDNYNALVIGFGPTERASDAIVSLAIYPGWVNLYFLHGAALPDLDGLLKGGGNQGRYIRLNSAEEIGAPGIAELLREALARAKTPLPETGKGYVVIKSISAKQRPRRSTEAV